MNPVLGGVAVGAVLAATVGIGLYGLRISRTTSDFFVASRSVRPWWNASAISGEYLSAGTFLGLSGLVLLAGAQAFWFPVGYAAGYLLVLMFVAAPLRRSGAYTLPDFVEARLGSRTLRRVVGALVLVIGWLYIVPQLHGAGLVIQVVAGLPPWFGAVGVAVVVGGAVASGGMRSVTFVQAFLYWLKLTALLLPVVVFLGRGTGGADLDPQLVFPAAAGPSGFDVYESVSLMLALLLGTAGLPHVLARFTTSPDGEQARRTTVLVVVLVSVFYAVSSTLGLIARVAAPDLARADVADTVALLLPSRLVPGTAGELLTALVVAGAFAAFLGTSSGLVVSLASVVSQEGFGGSVRSFRWSAVACALVPLAFALASGSGALVSSVGSVFVVAATTLSPVLLLSIWWRGMTARGAIAGALVGGASCLAAFVGSRVTSPADGALHAAFAQPAAWTIPLAVLVIVVVSRLDGSVPGSTDAMLARLHRPERTVRAPGEGERERERER